MTDVETLYAEVEKAEAAAKHAEAVWKAAVDSRRLAYKALHDAGQSLSTIAKRTPYSKSRIGQLVSGEVKGRVPPPTTRPRRVRH